MRASSRWAGARSARVAGSSGGVVARVASIRYGPIADQRATGPSRGCAAAARAAAQAWDQASASPAVPRRGSAIPAVAAAVSRGSSRAATVSAGVSASAERSLTSTASPGGPGDGATHTAAAPATEPGASAAHGVRHTTVCRPSPSGPRAERSAASAISRSQPRPAVRAVRNSRERSAPALASCASSTPIRSATSMAEASAAGPGPSPDPGSGSRSHT